jgi:hypothetical protein
MLTATGLTAWTKVLGPNSAPFPHDSPAIFTVSILKRPAMKLSSVDLAN